MLGKSKNPNLLSAMFSWGATYKPSRWRRGSKFICDSLEPRLLLSTTTALVQDSGSVNATLSAYPSLILFGFEYTTGPGELSAPQFDNSSNMLEGVSVAYKVNTQANVTGSYTSYPGQGYYLADLAWNEETDLSLPGDPSPQTALTTYSYTQTPVDPFATNPVINTTSSASTTPPNETANLQLEDYQQTTYNQFYSFGVPNQTADNSGAFSLTPAQALAAGYVGTGNQNFAYGGNATIYFNFAQDAEGIESSYNTTENVGVDVQYFYVTPGSISGNAFNDLNDNGVQDPGEPGLAGWTIDLNGTTSEIDSPGGAVLDPGGTAVSQQTTTDSNGDYSFGNLAPGVYTVTEDPGNFTTNPYWTQTSGQTGYTITVGADGTASVGNETGNNFGNFFHAPPSQLVFTIEPANTTAGVTMASVVVSIEDQYGDIETGDNSAIGLAINTGPAGGVFTPSSVLTVNASAGQATFSNLTLDTAGTYTLAASDSADSLANFPSDSFNITPAVATKLVFIQEPTNTMAGNAISPAVTVDIEDQYGNVETSDGSAVSLGINTGPAGGVFTPSSVLSVDANSGQATFANLTLDTAGAYTLNASDVADGLANFPSSSFNVTPAAATKLVFIQEPTNTTAGNALSPAVTVDIEDQYGNVETGDNSAVNLTIKTGPIGGVFTPSSVPSVNATSGQATFSNLTLDTAGTYTLAAADAADSLSILSSPFTIAPAAAVKLAFIQQPTNTTAGNAISPPVTVAIEDEYGNIVTSNNSYVTIALVGTPPCGGGGLSGLLTVQAHNGLATFSNLSLTKAGTYALKATDAQLGPATSNKFQIAPAAAVRMIFVCLPECIQQRHPFSVEVELLDKFGNVATNDTSTVTLSLGDCPKNGGLTGALTAKVVNGIATFDDLFLSGCGRFYLTATDSNGGIPSISAPLF
jgi:hypothetical protein